MCRAITPLVSDPLCDHRPSSGRKINHLRGKLLPVSSSPLIAVRLLPEGLTRYPQPCEALGDLSAAERADRLGFRDTAIQRT
jgi:hypothetical protein